MARVVSVAVALPPAAGRGTLRIADRVYRRLAARAAEQALDAAWGERTERGAPPRVAVLLFRGRARLTLRLELPYPADVTALACRVRDAVIAELTALTGTPVGDVTVLVDRLLAEPEAAPVVTEVEALPFVTGAEAEPEAVPVAVEPGGARPEAGPEPEAEPGAAD